MAKLKGAAKTKFLARMRKGRLKAAKKSTTKRKTRRVTQSRAPVRVIRKVIRKRSVARRTKRRSSPRRSKGFLKGLPIIGNSTFKKAAAGIGTATLGVAALSLIAPGIANSPLVKPVLALAGGDFIGLGAQLFTGGGLGGILGGSGGSNMGDLA